MILVTYVNRGAPVDRSGGLLAVAEDDGCVVGELLAPQPHHLDDFDRLYHGKRGLGGMTWLGGELYVATFDSLLVVDPDLRIARRLTHPWFNALHGVVASPAGTLWVTSTGIDAVLEVDATGAVLSAFFLDEEPDLATAPRGLDHAADLRRPVYPTTAVHPNHVSLAGDEVYVSLCHRGDLWALRGRRLLLGAVGFDPWTKLHDGRVRREPGALVVSGNSADTGVHREVRLSEAGVPGAWEETRTIDLSAYGDQDPTNPVAHGRRGWLRGHRVIGARAWFGQATAKLIGVDVGSDRAARVIPLGRGPTSSVVEILDVPDDGFARALLRGRRT